MCVCVYGGGGGGNCSSLNESSRLGEIVEAVKALQSAVKKTQRKTLSVHIPRPTCINLIVAHHRYTHTAVMKPYAYMHRHTKYQSSKPLCVLPSPPLW